MKGVAVGDPRSGWARLAALHRRVRAGGARWAPLRVALGLPAVAYSAVAKIRNLLFDCGVLRRRACGVRVISVGNLTAGGTGKTPVVALLAAAAQAAGLRPAILTRGYARGANAIKRGGGDEVLLYRMWLPDLPVVVDADRLRGAAAAIVAGADLLILDDGFQHRRLRRDIDLVLIDAREPFGGGWMLPLGLLREPARGLRRATVVMVTRCDRVCDTTLAGIVRRVAELAPGVPVVLEQHVATALRPFGDGPPRSLALLVGRRVLCFSGIAEPAALAESLTRLGAVVVRALDFGDHHEFSPAELQAIAAEAAQLAVDAIVTTEKDLMRIPGFDSEVPLYALSIAAVLPRAADIHSLGGLIGFELPRSSDAG